MASCEYVITHGRPALVPFVRILEVISGHLDTIYCYCCHEREGKGKKGKEGVGRELGGERE